MKNLGKAVEQILIIEPDLKEILLPIKLKWEKYPGKNTLYWKQLLHILNTRITPEHPDRLKIQGILMPPKKKIKDISTFEEPTKIESIVGTIPENLECKLRYFDKKQIEYAKLGVEARLTHNYKLIREINRKMEILENKQRVVWTSLKDHFDLWDLESSATYLVRKNKNLLVLTTISNPIMGMGDNLTEPMKLNLDPDMLKKFLKYFNINPPPGLFPE